MKKRIVSIIALVVLGLGWGSSIASAQGFSSILEKLDQLESRLNSLETGQSKEMETTPMSDIEMLRKQPTAMQTSSNVDPLSHSLRQTIADASAVESDSPAANASLPAADASPLVKGKLSGHMLGDYYYVASGSQKKQNGFQLGQVHYSYDVKWSEHFSGRFRLEAEGAGFGSNQALDPYMKDAFLRYERNGHSLSAGLVGTPTWSVSERIWGYRPVEKVIMDLNGAGAPNDLGVAFEGRLNEAGALNVQFVLGNGNGNRAEVNNGKKVYALLHAKPGKNLEATVYFDWQSLPADQDQMTWEALVGASGAVFHGGVEGFIQIRKNQLAGEEVKLQGLSVFGAGKLGKSTKAFARFDWFDPSDQMSDDYQYLLVGGVDLMPVAKVNIMPNVRVLFGDGPGVDTEVMPRLTGLFTF